MLRTLLGLAAATVALAGLYFGRELVAPLALGAVLVIICLPVRRPLERWGLPSWRPPWGSSSSPTRCSAPLA